MVCVDTVVVTYKDYWDTVVLAECTGVCKELLSELTFTNQLRMGEQEITSSIISVGEAAFVRPFNLTGGREFMSKSSCDRNIHFHFNQEYFIIKLISFLLTKFAKGNTALSLVNPILTRQPPRILRERCV